MAPTTLDILYFLQNYCQSLEQSLADLRQRFRDQNAEFNAVKIELARIKYYRDENQHLTNHLQKQQTDVEEVTKVSSFFISVESSSGNCELINLSS